MQDAQGARSTGRAVAAVATMALALAAGLLACSKKSSSPTSPVTPPVLGLQLVKSGLSFPVFLTSPPADTARLFVVQKGGAIRIIKSGNLLATPFLDISGLVSSGPEQGLLGMAFAPDYASSGTFYVSYTDAAGDSKVARYLVSIDPDVAQSAAQRVILTVGQPDVNHNGGMIAFGPDGYLFAGFGDGGGQNDQYGNGQDRTDFLGSLLRMDVSGTGDYGIPFDNPFLPPALLELWDYGLRNPWRFSFDRSTGDLYIGDVGQDQHEEIDVSTTASGRGKGANYGWPTTEGTACFSPSSGCVRTGLTGPILDYDHTEGCSVIGGYVYRGTAIFALQGTYFYADYCQGWVRSFRLSGGVATQPTDWISLRPGGSVTSFGQDARGELYVLSEQGTVHRIVAQ